MFVSDTIHYIGVNDRKIDLFEGQYVVPNGMSYNSYLVEGEKLCVMDTVDAAFTHEWLENLRAALKGRTPDYLVVQHMEPDHSSNVLAFANAYPKAVIVSSQKAFAMMKKFFGTEFEDRRIVVGEGDTLSLGGRSLHFVTAPMVHWPEVIMTYDDLDKVLFSADGFGKFGTPDTDEDWACEARRYYIGIVGKYGAQVQALLKKAATLDIETICPLHGPVLKDNLSYYLSLYDTWSSYRAEDEGVVIAYTSVYGNTKKAVLLLAEELKRRGCPAVSLFDLARCDMAEAVEDAFRYSKLVLATTTYNAEIFPFMRTFLFHLKERNFQNRTVAFIENGSWAPMAKKVMQKELESCKNLTLAKHCVTVHSALNEESTQEIRALADELCAEYQNAESRGGTDFAALDKIGYGLYVVTTRDGGRDNGLILNTVTQLTDSPKKIGVTVNRENYSHHIISRTKKLNVCCLTTDAPFKVFEVFGFASGRDTDKFADCTPQRSENGLVVLPRYLNAYFSLEVEDEVDLGTHTMFICHITEARTLSDKPSMTYAYYHEHVKPRPNATSGWVCKICGYVHEAQDLPADFICPLCKHGVDAFEKIQ